MRRIGYHYSFYFEPLCGVWVSHQTSCCIDVQKLKVELKVSTKKRFGKDIDIHELWVDHHKDLSHGILLLRSETPWKTSQGDRETRVDALVEAIQKSIQ